ncbi:MAG: thioredoxin fold domain-containing protein [Sulfurimicrobium sp.]|jgi:thioredoxin-related protein|nr:thioredoxin fold domain-containing protein [Sulfurimicrobium sp.]
MTTALRLFLLGCLFWAFAFQAHAAREAPLAPGMVNPGYEEHPAWFRESFLDLRDDVKEAQGKNRRVMLYFYQDGCPYCSKLLRDNFGQRAIADKTRQYFDVIALNLWGDREVTGMDGRTVTEKAFARQLRVMFTPTLLALNEKGETILRINGYYAPHQFTAALDYAGQGKEREGAFRDYLAANSAPAASGKLHANKRFIQPPLAFDDALRRSKKPLLVLFEQKTCQACDELHLDILKRKESRPLLDGLQIAQLDMWSDAPLITPDGRQSTAREWARQLDISYAPSMVFFDASGKEVFRAEAMLKAFHVQSVLDYVGSGAYRKYPEFQRYVDVRADGLRSRGIVVDLMK